MGQAREVLNRATTAVTSKDKETLLTCYAPDAVALTPDQGEIKGREAISDYLSQFGEAFPDLSYEYAQKYDVGHVASMRATSPARIPAVPPSFCVISARSRSEPAVKVQL
jgi:ketosteroid isomerase-like protein